MLSYVVYTCIYVCMNARLSRNVTGNKRLNLEAPIPARAHMCTLTIVRLQILIQTVQILIQTVNVLDFFLQSSHNGWTEKHRYWHAFE